MVTITLTLDEAKLHALADSASRVINVLMSHPGVIQALDDLANSTRKRRRRAPAKRKRSRPRTKARAPKTA